MEAIKLKREIIMIPAKNPADDPLMPKRQLRTAAYCRVSTDSDEQESSYKNQVDYYTDKIVSNPEWTMVRIYADEGISGTSAKKRPEFLKMIEDCKKGKIDLIITKKVSRFARNTVDCLHYVRLLKTLGIPVIFEADNLNTATIPNELMLTILSFFAQAESETISQNIRWGNKQRMKEGKVVFNYKHFLGYIRGADNQPEIEPTEAEIVRLIFNRYLKGQSVLGIKQELEGNGILTKSGKTEWSTNAIRSMLQNEKYTGDVLLQKTYVADVLTHKVKKNNGELPQFLVKNNHPGIIDHSTFYAVQEEMARRAGKRKVSDKTLTELSKYSGLYALTDLLICSDCCTPYKRVTWARSGKKKIVWRCVSRLDYGTKYCKESPSIEESALHVAILRAINSIYNDNDGTKEMVIQNLRAAISGGIGEAIDTVTLENRIRELDMAIRECTKAMPIDYDRIKELSDEITTHKATLQGYEVKQKASDIAAAQLDRICEALEGLTDNLNEWDDELVRELIHTVKVISKDKILVIFRTGMEVKQDLYEEQE